MDRYLKNTKAYIVKFRENGGKIHYIRPILNYIYTLQHNIEISMYCSADFDGGGITIPEKDIIYVEHVTQ